MEIINNEKVYNDDVCSICLEKPQTRVNLSCKHKFCYLCLKETVKHGDYKCPMCRADIPQDFAENAVESIDNLDNVNYVYSFRWAYAGRTGGWWFYQEDHNDIIEKGWQLYKSGDGVSQVEITVCSTNYTIDFCNKIQLHSNCVGIHPRGGFDPAARKIKRMENVTLIHTKGVAGLRSSLKKNYLKINRGHLQKRCCNESHNYFNPNNVNIYLNDCIGISRRRSRFLRIPIKGRNHSYYSSSF